MGPNEGDSAPGKPTPRWARTGVGLLLTAVIVILPLAGSNLGYAMSGEPLERDLTIAGMWTAAALATLVWAGLGLMRLVRRMNLMAASATIGVARRVEDPQIIRMLLASHDFPCATCGYNLRGLSAGPCPECREPITVHLAGADLSQPVVWLARLAAAACGAYALSSALSLWQVVRVWSYLGFARIGPSGVGRGVLRAKIAMALPPVVAVVSLLILIVAVVAWGKAGPGPVRGIARWRALNVAVSLLALMGMSHLIALVLYL